MEVLRELVSLGYSGQELVKQFEAERTNLKKGAREMIEEADRVAEGSIRGASFEDVFGTEVEYVRSVIHCCGRTVFEKDKRKSPFKEAFREAILLIVEDPSAGNPKRSDLSGHTIAMRYPEPRSSN